MPKPKQFLKDKKKSKLSTQVPATADEFLEAGVDFEEAGEKWRAGDAAKSTRFFLRALECYDAALKKFPDSFDLAYNKARVQYDLTQYPKLAAQLPGTLLDLLKTALESSRYALHLSQDNADVLFNTAQVLTSLVEALSETRSSGSEDSLALLEEAVELFQRCLSLQEYQHTEAQAQQQAFNSQDPTEIPDSDEASASLSDPDSHQVEEERWATIVEPVTNDTLLDTLLAQLETLTTLCGLINADAGKGLTWIEEYSSSLLNEKLPAYLQETHRQAEAALTRANFICALADANFRSRRLDIGTYEHALQEVFSTLAISNDPEALCDKAEALISFNTAIRVNADTGSLSNEVSASRWKALSVALESLTAASRNPNADNVAKIHLVRGDVELLRFQLGQAPSQYDIALKNGQTLVKNAEKFYRGACNLAKSTGEKKLVAEAYIKEALAAGLGGDVAKIQAAAKEENQAQEVLEDAIDDGLITLDELTVMGIV